MGQVNRPLAPSVTTLFTGEHQQRTILETTRVDVAEHKSSSPMSRSREISDKQRYSKLHPLLMSNNHEGRHDS